MPLKKFALAILVSILTATFCLSQQNNQSMTNQDVIEMTSSGFSDGVIVDKIHAANSTNFDTSVEALKTLQAAKVSDVVMRAMINPKPVADTATVASDFNDPSSPHDPGMYMYTKTRDGMKMTLLEPTAYQGAASAGAFMLSMGIAKAKIKAVVKGAHAEIASDDSNMAFYFYFADGTGFSSAWGVPTSPNEFTLLKFAQKSGSRETVLATANAFGGSTETDKKSPAFRFTKIRSGVYKVTPNAPLVPGEYCFLSPSTFVPPGYRLEEANRLFDFAVLPAGSGSMASAASH